MNGVPASFRALLLALVAIGWTAGTAHAQLIGKEPYDFRGRTPSGMSLGYRQAMLQFYATGAHPNQLVRDPSGNLLSVDRERGGSAFVSTPGGTFLPGYRTFGTGGLAFLGGSAAGGFNAYFAGGGYGGAGWGGYPATGNWSYLAALASYGLGGARGENAPAYLVGSDTTPIDTWISQLNSL